MSRGRIRLHREIRATAADVFRALTDLERTPEWDTRVQKVTQMTRGPLRPGVILRSTLIVDGETTHLDDEITDFDPPTRFGLRSVHGNTNAVTYSLVEDESDLTQVDVSLTYDLPEPPPELQLDEAALQAAITAALDQALDLLRDLVEKDSTRE